VDALWFMCAETAMDVEYASYFDYRHYPLTMPPLENGADPKRHRVAIAGGGPIGMALALGLANYGIPSLLIDADDTVCAGSRAICTSRRSLEIFDRLGVAGRMTDKGLAWTGGRSFYRNTEVFRLRMPHDENQKFPPMINIQQCHIEQYLVEEIEKRRDLIEIRWQTTVTGIATHDDRVSLMVETAKGPYRIDAEWAVACDGARSVIRQALGLKLEGTQYEGRYVIVDIELKSGYPTERRAWFDPPSNPGSTLLMHKQPGNIWRIDYQLRDDEDPDEAVKPENVLPRVRSHLRMIGEREDWRPVWISMYKANALTLPSYRHGRVLFAGDAAHLVPIFGVRGMNSGIDDTHNLAWKLAFVIRGLARDTLLDTYSEERVFATHENLRLATKSTEFMAPPSRGFRVMREAVLSLAAKHEWVRSLIDPRQTSVISFPGSALNAFPRRSHEFSAGPQPGEVLAEYPIEIIDSDAVRHCHLTDLLGPHFTALYFTEAGAVPEALADTMSRITRGAVPFAARVISRESASSGNRMTARDHTGRLFPMYDAAAGSVYLVRPDGHVMARWRAAVAEELDAAIRHALDPKGERDD
jgi:3-(3-hydroxy-phenyl)propionate hydroxylase